MPAVETADDGLLDLFEHLCVYVGLLGIGMAIGMTILGSQLIEPICAGRETVVLGGLAASPCAHTISGVTHEWAFPAGLAGGSLILVGATVETFHDQLVDRFVGTEVAE